MRKTLAVVKDNEKTKGRIRKEKASSRYPWDQWFLLGKVTLTRGKHFHCQPHGMAMNARHAAKRKGVLISANVDNDKVTITVH